MRRRTTYNLLCALTRVLQINRNNPQNAQFALDEQAL